MSDRIQWMMPAASASEDTKKGWLIESRQEAENYLRSQRAWNSIKRGMDAIADDRNDPSDPSLSQTRYNVVKRGIKEIVSTLSNLRIVPNYFTHNPLYEHQAQILNKRYEAWYFETHAYHPIKKALQWAAVSGMGYLYLDYSREFGVIGTPENRLKAMGPQSVLIWGMGEEHDLQRAYIVTFIHEIPYHEAVGKFPTQADRLIVGAKPSSLLRKGARGASRWLSPMMKMAFGSKEGNDPEAYPIATLYESYVLDTSTNTTDSPVMMGDPDTSWFYPAYPSGGTVPTGLFENGKELLRKADLEDTLLYPTRRRIWWNDQGIFSDGPSAYWHGYVPAVQFQFDSWAWEYLGYPLTHDTLPLQKSIRDGLRVMDDCQNVRTRPPLAYAKDRVSRNMMKSFDPRVPMNYLGFEGLTLGDMKALIQPVLPAQYYEYPATLPEHEKSNEQRIDRMLGVLDALALTKARQMPAGDTIDKIMELLGPLIGDMSRSMDSAIIRLGEMLKVNFLQFDTVEKRYQLLGQDGHDKADFDYDPAKLIPEEFDPTSKIKSLFERGRKHASNFTFQVRPGNMHQITSLTRRLILYQLYKTPGFPMDPWTMAEAFDIQLGPKPKNCNTIIELWAEWQKILAVMGREIGQLGGVPLSEPKHGHKGGRPPSGNAPPQIKVRPNGQTTVQESR